MKHKTNDEKLTQKLDGKILGHKEYQDVPAELLDSLEDSEVKKPIAALKKPLKQTSSNSKESSFSLPKIAVYERPMNLKASQLRVD